jgi:hypothetical protein
MWLRTALEGMAYAAAIVDLSGPLALAVERRRALAARLRDRWGRTREEA